MRKVLLGLVIAFGGALVGCGSTTTRPNDPTPAPQDSGADKKSTEPRPSPPKPE